MIADYPRAGEPPVGGPQVAVHRLVEKLVEREIDVIVIAPDPVGATVTETVSETGTSIVRTPSGSRWTLARRLQPWRRNATRVLERIRADVAHGQGLLPGGIAAADAHEIPVIVTARGNARADTEAEYAGIGGRLRAYLRNRLAERAVEHADVVIGVNPDWEVNVPRRPARFAYIPNMIDDAFFEQRFEPEPGVVLFAGGVSRAIKGWPLLAEAWGRVVAAVPEARLQVVGWPPEHPLSGIDDQYVGTINSSGWLPSADLAARMAHASVLVIPSQFEVSPIVLAEAWAIGLPVVAVPVGGIPALATGAALLVERRPEPLAEGIVEALKGGEHVGELVAEGRRRAEAHRPDNVAAAHVDLYNDLLSNVRA
jgi:glycosyltransferase involved in cell wall biosynthesis